MYHYLATFICLEYLDCCGHKNDGWNYLVLTTSNFSGIIVRKTVSNL
jgi:hypothetical protein